jgi:hypothetical protein
VIVSYYHQWDSIPFVPSELRAAWDRGAVPMITWEPMSYSGRHYPMRLIQRGRFDEYIRKMDADENVDPQMYDVYEVD